MSEIIESFKSTSQWWTLAMFDIRQRYRRSVLGPLWITLSTGLMVGSLGVLWSTLFKTPLEEFMPFFAAGLIVWTFISSQINEAGTIYPQFEGYIKQISLPLPLYILRVLARNVILFAHNLLVFLVVWIYFKFQWTPNLPMAITGFLVLSLVLFFMSVPLAALCARFRDITPIIQALMQILFFFTPIMWQHKVLGEQFAWVVAYNPFAHLIEIVREPLLGRAATMENWIWVLGTLAVSAFIAVVTHARYRKRVAYWL